MLGSVLNTQVWDVFAALWRTAKKTASKHSDTPTMHRVKYNRWSLTEQQTIMDCARGEETRVARAAGAARPVV